MLLNSLFFWMELAGESDELLPKTLQLKMEEQVSSLSFWFWESISLEILPRRRL